MIKDLLKYLKMFQIYLGSKIYIIYFLGVITAFLEGIGIVMVLPLLESLDNINNLENLKDKGGFINEFVLNMISFVGLDLNVGSILIFITIAFILKGLISFLSLAYNSKLKGDLLFKLKENLFEGYRKMKYSYYTKKDTGYFSNIINEQPTKALQAFNQIILFGGHLINSIVLLSIAFIMTWMFGVMALFAGVILLLLFKRLNNFVRNLGRETGKENGVLTKWLIQTLHGYKYLSATSQFEKIKESVMKSIKILTDNQIKAGYASSFTKSVREPIAVIFIMIVIYIQIFILNQKFEPILVSVILFYRALNSIHALQSSLQATFQFIGSMEIVDNEFKNLKENKDENGELKLESFSKSIKFKNISFEYKKDKLILDKISLEIPFLKSVGLVGTSGSGKSTILDLISMIHNPKSGNLFIDEINVCGINKDSWRSQIGYVSQDTVIFDDTIANNISMWSGNFTNDKYAREKIISCAKKANILDFIEGQEEGFETKVGERGVLLSGGQKQRLFIARELYRDPKVLLLDEATSALDSVSEKHVQQSIDKLKGSITTIIVAHRLSTLRNVDKIFVIDKGKILEQGSFKQLLQKNSHFQKLVKLQEV